MYKRLLIALFLFLFLLLGAGCRAQEKNESLVFETVSRDIHSAIEEQTFEVIDDREEMEGFLQTADIRLEKEIDFHKHMVIAVFIGQKPTGGYDVEIKRIMEGKDQITVFFELIEPSEDDMVIQVLTSPYHMVLIEKTEKEVVFERQ